MNTRLKISALHFRRCTSGSIAMMTGLFISFLVPTIIASVDLANITTEKQTIQNQLDSAILVATQSDDLEKSSKDGTLQAKGENFLRNALIAAGVDPDRTMATFIYDAKENVVRAIINYDAPSLFVGHVIDLDMLTITAETTPREEASVEIALALDVSGSMAFGFNTEQNAPVGSRRIDALRDGVNQLLKTLDQEKLISPRYSVTPYSSSVNIGELFHTSRNLNQYFEGARGRSFQELGLFRAAVRFIMSMFGSNRSDQTSQPGVWATERTERSGAGGFRFSTRQPQGNQRVPVTAPTNVARSCNGRNVRNFGQRCINVVNYTGGNTSGWFKQESVFSPATGVMPLNKPDTIPDYISNLEPEGATAIHLGTAWALYSLLPEWQNVFNTPEMPAAAPRGKTRKILVVMTDGDITLTHTNGMSTEEAYDYFQNVCKEARNLGVDIYTVGLKASPETDQELTKCAGSRNNYFPVSDRAALNDAFEQIARETGKLRISG